MAGRLVVSTLNNDTGVLQTQNGMTGIPKAWVNFNGSSGATRATFNVSSVTRNGTGDYTINFTTAMPDVNYTLYACGDGSSAAQSARCFTAYTVGTTSAQRINCYNPAAGVFQDPTYCYVGIIGN